MRITNQMITSNSLRNMQGSMRSVNSVTQQLTTGKKISKPSEDPVVAIRALKLRTTVDQLYQYKNKNIPDAQSWLDISTTALTNITKRITDINDYCVQGSTDSFGTSDRGAIIDGLSQLKDMIYSEGNSTYAGRYIFSGYKTDRSLAFTEMDNLENYSYDITEHLTADDLDMKSVVWDGIDEDKLDAYIAGTDTYTQPNQEQIYRLNLAYEGISEKNNDGDTVLSLQAKDSTGTAIDLSGYTTTVMDSGAAANYYEVGADEIHIIQETGEIVFGENVYNTLKGASDISVSYAKTEFNAGDLRPEHYFDCTQYEVQSDGSVKDTDFTYEDGGQPIYYEVNFDQKIKVNTEGTSMIKTEIGNNINDLIYTLQDLQSAEETQANLQAMLKDTQYSSNDEAVAQINQMLEDIDVEIAQKKEVMQQTFSANITNFQQYLSEVSAVQSDVGSRMSKLEMIETRVKEQHATFKELKSTNEDVETDAAIIDFNEAELVYQSALAATGGIMTQTLLDYL